jgi:hypothetical protein
VATLATPRRFLDDARMNLRSLLTSASVLSLALTLTACPPDDEDTASATQATTTAPMTGTTMMTSTTGTTDPTTGTTDTPTSSTTATTGGTAPAFADIQAIFTASCSCHLNAPDPSNGQMELTDGKAHANTVGVPSSQLPAMNRITPGDPANSYLWLKLVGGYMEAGGGGDPMPLIGDLTQDQLDTIEAWIIAGAPAD